MLSRVEYVELSQSKLMQDWTEESLEIKQRI